MNDMIILDLVLKGKWYDMIERGAKLEEYREIKPYWDRRLFSRPYTHVRFRRGYTKKSMTYTIPSEIRKGFGFAACWGAPSVHNTYWNKSAITTEYEYERRTAYLPHVRTPRALGMRQQNNKLLQRAAQQPHGQRIEESEMQRYSVRLLH